MSTHISAKKGEIAKIVFLAGDPLRAKFMAKKYLSNVKEVSSVRNENYYTGEYKGHKVTFGSSGMGQFSISTYAHELYNDYDVDVIIRTGSTGAYIKDLDVMRVVIINRAYSDNTSVAQLINNESVNEYYPDKEITNKLIASAKKLHKNAYVTSVHSTDVFYGVRPLEKTIKVTGSEVIEAESFALYAEAKRSNKKAATILQVSDNIPNLVFTDSKTRETKFTDMFEVTLDAMFN